MFVRGACRCPSRYTFKGNYLQVRLSGSFELLIHMLYCCTDFDCECFLGCRERGEGLPSLAFPRDPDMRASMLVDYSCTVRVVLSPRPRFILSVPPNHSVSACRSWSPKPNHSIAKTHICSATDIHCVLTSTGVTTIEVLAVRRHKCFFWLFGNKKTVRPSMIAAVGGVGLLGIYR